MTKYPMDAGLHKDNRQSNHYTLDMTCGPHEKTKMKSVYFYYEIYLCFLEESVRITLSDNTYLQCKQNSQMLKCERYDNSQSTQYRKKIK